MVFGQNSKWKFKADRYFDRLAYSQAIDLYQRHLKKYDDPEAVLRLAECYRLTKQYNEAAKWYERVMSLDYQPSITRYHYAHTLMQQGRLEEAAKMFESYTFLEPNDQRGENYSNALKRFDQLLDDSTFYTIDLLPINTEYSDFGAWPHDGQVVFASSRKEGSVFYQNFDWLDAPFLSFYHARPKGEDTTHWSVPKPLKGDINSRYHESNFTQADSGRVYFTRNNYFQKRKGESEQGIILLKIYSGRMDGWEVNDIREFPYNSDNYSLTHPCLSRDGKTIYFTSDMPGGFGGKDIYKCEWINGGWGQPQNLGNLVNTPGDEMFPFIHEDGSLYFSSDGHPGMGHLDNFVVRLTSKSQQVVNLGYPINSPYDDFAIYMQEDKEGGYFSSNRPSKYGDDDIYSFTMIRPVIEIIVLDSVAQLPIENAEIIVNDYQFQTTDTFLTDLNGEITFKTDFGGDFDAHINTLEFSPEFLEMSTRTESNQLVFRYRVVLYNPPPAITALVIDEETQERLPGARVDIIKLINNDTIRRVADRNGRIAVKLEETTYYEISVRAQGYLNYTNRFSTTQWALDGDTIIPMKLTKLEFNKPYAIDNIHYDFDKFYIKQEYYGPLAELAKTLLDNPTLVIELGSHTDCRGSDTYNEWLSSQRAKSARNILINMGVAPERIHAKGYGEYVLANHCRDGVPCTDDEHYQNRRTEFKIIGTISDVDMEHSTLYTDERILGIEEAPDYTPEKRDELPGSRIYKGGWVKQGPPKTEEWNPNLQRDIENKRKKDQEEKNQPVTEKQAEPVKKQPEKAPEPVVKQEELPVNPVQEPVVVKKEENALQESSVKPIGRERENGHDEQPPYHAPEGKEELPHDDSQRNPATEQPSEPVKVVEQPKVEQPAEINPVEEKVEEVAIPDRVEEVAEEPVRSKPLDANLTEDEPFVLGDLPPEMNRLEDNESANKQTKFDRGESSVGTSGIENHLPDYRYEFGNAGADTTMYVKIQIGAFKGELGASALDRLKEYKPYLEHTVENELNVYRVGDFLNYQEAEEAQKKIRSYGFGTFITVWKNGKQLSFLDLQQE